MFRLSIFLCALSLGALCVGGAATSGLQTVSNKASIRNPSGNPSRSSLASPALKEEEEDRDLKKITIFITPKSPPPTVAPTKAPTQAPTKAPTKDPTPAPTQDIWIGYEKCNQQQIPACADTTDVKFYFRVETNTAENPSNMMDVVCDNMEEQIVNSILDEHCESNRRLGRRLSDAVVIHGVASEMKCELVSAECDSFFGPDAESCTTYSAEVSVIYSDGSCGTSRRLDGSDGRVESAILPTIEEEIEKDGTRDNINEDLDDGSTSVTTITYTGAENEVVPGVSSPELVAADGGLTKSGKIAISVCAILAILVALLIRMWCRKKVIEEDKSMGTRDNTFIEEMEEDEQSYMTADFNNLGGYSRKRDVHHCASATCKLCAAKTSQSPDSVSFVSSKGVTLRNFDKSSSKEATFDTKMMMGAVQFTTIQEEEDAVIPSDESADDISDIVMEGPDAGPVVFDRSLTDQEAEEDEESMPDDERVSQSRRFGWGRRSSAPAKHEAVPISAAAKPFDEDSVGLQSTDTAGFDPFSVEINEI